MQTVSPSYVPYPDARWSNLRVVFSLVDTTAAGDATASSNGAASVSQIVQTHDEVEEMSAKWAALETNGWPLDGSCDIFPDDVSGLQTGWWSSEVSLGDCSFVTDPALTFEFAVNHNSIGFEVLFDDKADWYPDEFIVSVYDGSNALIDSATVQCTSARQSVELPVADYRKVVLIFTKTQAPYQRIRVAEVLFGIVQSFNSDNLTNGTILHEISPMALFLPSNQMTITIDNSDRKYNMINPNGIYKYLQQGQPIDSELGVGADKANLEYVKMGRAYYTKSEAQDDAMTANIISNDRFYQLDKSICRIGTTGTWTVSAAVAAVIADSGLSITAVIPAEIGTRVINKCIPADAKHREALRLIAQAGKSTCFFNRDDELEFIEMAEGAVVDTLDNDNLSSPAKIAVSERVNTVELTVRDEYAETETIYTASELEPGETPQVLSVKNPLGNQATADWLLLMAQKRLIYELKERGNPARELTDTVKVYDKYGENLNAVIIKEEYSFDGTLSARSNAWG